MKIELDLPEIEGYEYTGKNRQAKGEHFLTSGNRVGFQPTPLGYTIGHYPILKKKAPKYKTITPASYLQQSGCIDFSAEYVEIKALEDALELSSGMTMNADDIAIYKELYSLLN
jgi:hypothetical protein